MHQRAGRAVALDGQAEHLFALHAVAVGIGGAVDGAAVGADGDVLGGFARVPRPPTGILLAFGQLRHELQRLTLRHGGIIVDLEGVHQSTQLVVIDGLTVDEFACALLTYAWDETRGNRPAVLHLRRELRGHLVGGTKLNVAGVHEHAIA